MYNDINKNLLWRFLSAGDLEDENKYYKTVQDLIQYNQVLMKYSYLSTIGCKHCTDKMKYLWVIDWLMNCLLRHTYYR